MRNKVSATTVGYYFPSKPNLLWYSGKFWIGDTPAKMVCNNGSLSVLYGGTKLGVRKLRKEAAKCNVTVSDYCPF